jgi:protein-S-isoprenylcysteine O-methyltransferase Ste14
MEPRLAWKLVVQTAVWLAGMAALLFIPAGTLAWPAAWVFLAEMAIAGVGIGWWLGKRDPELLQERLSPLIQREQPLWDRVLLTAFVLLWCAWMVLMALDAARFRWSHVPTWLQGAGAIAIVVSLYVSCLVLRENSYAAPVVKIQEERGQKVVTTGPYRCVRHPMYAGGILYFLGMPLLLGSWCGLAVAPVMMGVLAVRAVLEERTLRGRLEGYAEYAERVRYRLIPGVW